MNIKNIKIGLVFIFLGLLFAQCGDDYLETQPTQLMSAESIKKASELKPELLNASIAGLYTTMYETSTGGTGGHWDFGQRGYDIFSDMLCGDMVLGGLTYGWYATIARYQATTDYTMNEAYGAWRYYYRIVFGANQVIDGLGGNDIVPEKTEAKHILGQAKAMRAYAYFYLANFYALEYAPEVEILPLYVTTTVPNQPLSTTAKIYEVIVKDLNDAIALLGDFERPGKQAINKYVAEGLLAYVYATMGNNVEAAKLADDIITNGGFTLMNKDEITGGFNDVNTKGWMWGVDLTLDSGLDLVSWWGQADIFTYSYAMAGDTKIINADLYNKIPADDARKAQFFPNPTHWAAYTPFKKFYAPEREIGKQRKITTDYVYMRVAEMYLLKAETLAKSGDEGGAKQALKALLAERLPNSNYVDALSGQALLDEIYLQTRIELWGEGKSYLAMKRNKATITRGSNDLVKKGLSFKYNDPELTFEIPRMEVDNNPNITK